MENWTYWKEGIPPEISFMIVLLSYFAIFKLKEGTKDENNLYNKNILNV